MRHGSHHHLELISGPYLNFRLLSDPGLLGQTRHVSMHFSLASVVHKRSRKHHNRHHNLRLAYPCALEPEAASLAKSLISGGFLSRILVCLISRPCTALRLELTMTILST